MPFGIAAFGYLHGSTRNELHRKILKELQVNVLNFVVGMVFVIL